MKCKSCNKEKRTLFKCDRCGISVCKSCLYYPQMKCSECVREDFSEAYKEKLGLYSGKIKIMEVFPSEKAKNTIITQVIFALSLILIVSLPNVEAVFYQGWGNYKYGTTANTSYFLFDNGDCTVNKDHATDGQAINGKGWTIISGNSDTYDGTYGYNLSGSQLSIKNSVVVGDNINGYTFGSSGNFTCSCKFAWKNLVASSGGFFALYDATGFNSLIGVRQADSITNYMYVIDNGGYTNSGVAFSNGTQPWSEFIIQIAPSNITLMVNNQVIATKTASITKTTAEKLYLYASYNSGLSAWYSDIMCWNGSINDRPLNAPAGTPQTVPNMVINITNRTTNNSINVSWSYTLQVNGGVMILQNGTNIANQTYPHSSYNITGLLNNTLYNITLFSYNSTAANFTINASNSQNFRTGNYIGLPMTIPYQVSGITNNTATNTSLNISWSYNSQSNGGVILLVDNVNIANITYPSSSVGIYNLTNNTAYLITLKSFNSTGINQTITSANNKSFTVMQWIPTPFDYTVNLTLPLNYSILTSTTGYYFFIPNFNATACYLYTNSSGSYAQRNSISSGTNITTYYNTSVISNNLVNIYNFEEGSGSTIIDSRSNQNGSSQNSPAYVSSKGANGTGAYALDFNGANQWVNLSQYANFERTQAFSITFWLKTSYTPASQSNVFGKMDNTLYRGYEVFIGSDGKINFALLNALSNYLHVRSETKVVNDNNWHFVAISYNGGSSSGSVNFTIDKNIQSMYVVKDNLAGTIITPESVRIGVDNTGFYYNGIIDNLIILNKSINSSEISELYDYGNLTDKTVNSTTTMQSLVFNQTYNLSENYPSDWLSFYSGYILCNLSGSDQKSSASANFYYDTLIPKPQLIPTQVYNLTNQSTVNNTILLNWTNGIQINGGAKVYANGTLKGTTVYPANTYLITGLLNSSLYNITVLAYNGTGTNMTIINGSNLIFAYSGLYEPEVVIVLNATYGNQFINQSWFNLNGLSTESISGVLMFIVYIIIMVLLVVFAEYIAIGAMMLLVGLIIIIFGILIFATLSWLLGSGIIAGGMMYMVRSWFVINRPLGRIQQGGG